MSRKPVSIIRSDDGERVEYDNLAVLYMLAAFMSLWTVQDNSRLTEKVLAQIQAGITAGPNEFWEAVITVDDLEIEALYNLGIADMTGATTAVVRPEMANVLWTVMVQSQDLQPFGTPEEVVATPNFCRLVELVRLTKNRLASLRQGGEMPIHEALLTALMNQSVAA